MRSWVLWNILKFISNESHENIPDCQLCWDVYIIYICNVLILSDYCVTIKNELLTTFTSLEIEVPECFVLSGIIG
jgi:hypothetical protein